MAFSKSPPSILWRLIVLPSSGAYSPINQVDLLSSKPTKSVATLPWAAGAAISFDIVRSP